MKRHKVVAGIATLVVAVVVALALIVGGSPDDALSIQTTSTTTSTTATPPAAEDDGVPDEYKLVFYQFIPGVPQNYFGPACVPNGDAFQCKKDLEDRIKHDPMLLSVQMRNFKLLPGWTVFMTPEEVETLRQEWADKLEADWELRKEWSTRVAGVLDSLQNLRVEALSGPYYTEYATADGVVHQSQKQMDPTVNIALVGEDAEGQTHHIKLDCGHQTVSPNPIPGTPMGPLPPGEQAPPPGTPVFRCPPAVGVPEDKWDFTTCRKKAQPWEEQQNGTPFWRQGQDNTTSGVDVHAGTPGAPAQPITPPAGPAPVAGTPAPTPTPNGSDSGSPTGYGTPGGSTTDSNGTTGGGPTPPQGPPPTVDTGTHNSDPGL